MKRALCALLAVCMVFSAMAAMTFSVSAAMLDNPKYTFFAKFIGENDSGEYEGNKLNIDGILATDEWNAADFQSWPKTDDNKIAFYYDNENLYVGVKIKNEEYNIPFYPCYWFDGQDRFNFWMDPKDEQIESLTEGRLASFFIEFCTQYASNMTTWMFSDDSDINANLGAKVAAQLIYAKPECASNMDKIMTDYKAIVTSEEERSEIFNTYTDGKPYGMPIPNGEWTFEYKIPFTLTDSATDFFSDGYTVTDKNEYGTYFTFGGWYQESKDSVRENVESGGRVDTVNIKNYMLSGNTRSSYQSAVLYFSEVRPGQKAPNPAEKTITDINPSGEAERTAEGAHGYAYKANTNKIKIDGKLDSSEWDMKKLPSQNPSNEFDSYYDIRWDKNNVYIAVDTGDKTVATPESCLFKDLNSPTDPIMPETYDFIRIDLDLGCKRAAIDTSDRAFSLYFPRTPSGYEEYYIAGIGTNWGNSNIKKGLSINTDMNVRYSNALSSDDSWKAEMAIPWSMFRKDGSEDLMPIDGNTEDFYGKAIEFYVGYSNSVKTKVIAEREELVSGETEDEIVIVTSEEDKYIPNYNGICDSVGNPYTYPFLRFVKDEGIFTTTYSADKKTVTYKGDKTYFDNNTYNLAYTFDAKGFDKTVIEMPVSSLNRQNYTSYYIDCNDGIQINIPSGIFTNNILISKNITKNDTVKFIVEAADTADATKFKADDKTGLFSFKIEVNGKTFIPGSSFKILYPLDKTVDTEYYDIRKPVCQSETGDAYPLSFNRYTEKFDEDETCTLRTYTIKSNLSGLYGISVNDLEVSDLQQPGDESKDGWYKEYVKNAIKHGIIKGYDEDGKKLFKPENDISRAEVAAIVMRLTQLTSNKTADMTKFDDVDSGHWADSMIHDAKFLGIINGKGDNKFLPDDPIVRAEFFKIFYYSAVKTGLKFADTDEGVLPENFNSTDFGKMVTDYTWAITPAAFMMCQGFVSGRQESDGRLWLCPGDPVTRGEVAKIISLFIDDYVKPQCSKIIY